MCVLCVFVCGVRASVNTVFMMCNVQRVRESDVCTMCDDVVVRCARTCEHCVNDVQCVMSDVRRCGAQIVSGVARCTSHGETINRFHR